LSIGAAGGGSGPEFSLKPGNSELANKGTEKKIKNNGNAQ